MTYPTAAPLSYLLSKTPAAGEAVPVAQGVTWLRLPLPFELDHINVWLLDDGDSRTLVDTGAAASKTRATWQSLGESLLAERPIARIIVTHYHPDHIGLAAELSARFGCTVHMSRTTRERTRELVDGAIADADIAAFCRRHGIREAEEYARYANGSVYREIISGVPGSIAWLEEGDEIEAGGNTWRCLIVDGHAEGHAVLYCEAINAVITGDQVLPSITSNVSRHAGASAPENPLKDYLDSMTRLAALPEDVLVLPSHGRVFRGLHARIAQIRAHHERKLGELEELCDRPQTAGELVSRFFKRELRGLHGVLGLGETLAHLVYLEHRGRLRVETAGGQLRYGRA